MFPPFPFRFSLAAAVEGSFSFARYYVSVPEPFLFDSGSAHVWFPFLLA